MAPQASDPEAWTHREAVINGIRLHYVEAGSGPLALLLHGFPEFWYTWRRQIPALARAGFRVIAPDLRGYNQSDKPAGVRPYQVSLVANDVASLICHADAAPAKIVGHDWGGSVAWQVAMRHPQIVQKLVVLNAPHPVAFQRGLARPSQLLKSWYVFFFLAPLATGSDPPRRGICAFGADAALRPGAPRGVQRRGHRTLQTGPRSARGAHGCH
jgi:epoxide hydrolase 4